MTTPAVVVSDDQPEAPSPVPTRVFYMKVAENRVADDYDGGLISFQVLSGNEDLVDGRLVLSARHDAFMLTYPWKNRSAKQGRVFKLTLEEIDPEQIPVIAAPKPATPALLGTQASTPAK